MKKANIASPGESGIDSLHHHSSNIILPLWLPISYPLPTPYYHSNCDNRPATNTILALWLWPLPRYQHHSSTLTVTTALLPTPSPRYQHRTTTLTVTTALLPTPYYYWLWPSAATNTILPLTVTTAPLPTPYYHSNCDHHPATNTILPLWLWPPPGYQHHTTLTPSPATNTILLWHHHPATQIIYCKYK